MIKETGLMNLENLNKGESNMETNQLSVVTIKGIRGYIDSEGTAWLNLEDVSRGLGFITVATCGNETIRWNRVYQYLKDYNYSVDDSKESYQAKCPEYNGINCSKNRAREIISEVIKHEFFHSYQYLYIREKYGSDFLKEILLLEHSKSWENRFLEQEAIRYSKGQSVLDFSNY